MDAVTYPDPRVAESVGRAVVPVKVSFKESPEEAASLGAIWTPTFQFRTADGRLIRSTTGYLAPDAFLAELAMGEGTVALAERRYREAEEILRRAALETAESVQTPEALYWFGVSRYRASGKPDGMLESWNDLLNRFPQSAWAMRASFIREGPAEKKRAG